MIASSLSITAEVRAALAEGGPVTAIEWPKEELPPRDVPLIVELEAAVRRRGAIPATIVVVDGRIEIGLEAGELETLARRADVRKITSADLAYSMVIGGFGAPTVGATLALSRLAGIAVLCAGGIGGVHRGFGQTMDVSADLEQLARSPVCVVCGGAKTILDVPNTLEYLETRSVPVIGWQTDAFPSYWSRESGARVPNRVDDVETLACIAHLHFGLEPATGIVVANPLPAAAEVPLAEVRHEVDRALEEAINVGVSGPAVTPFLLKRVSARIGRRATTANVALLLNNAELAGSLAVAISRISTRIGTASADLPTTGE